MPNDASFLSLTDANLQTLGIAQSDIVDAIETAVMHKAEGKIWVTPKSALLPGDARYMMTTLSASDAPKLSVVKFVMVSPDNPSQGLPAINGSILIHDSETGLLKAVLEAGWVTAVRTAGLSGVAARKLANPKARSIGFIGTGVQAQSHLDIYRALFPIEEIKIFGRGQANIDALKTKAEAEGLSAHVAATAQDAVSDVDLVVTSITLNYDIAPFLDANWLKPGCFAAITDLGIPWHDESLTAFANIVIDDRDQEAEAPKKLAPPALIAGDLADLTSGKTQAAFTPQAPSAFLFRGIAIGDYAIACLGYERALATGIGHHVPR